jgi:hypothetical protein
MLGITVDLTILTPHICKASYSTQITCITWMSMRNLLCMNKTLEHVVVVLKDKIGNLYS